MYTVFPSYLYQAVQIQAPVVICFDFHLQASHKDIHFVGICTEPSCKNELEWSPGSSSTLSRLHHGYLVK